MKQTSMTNNSKISKLQVQVEKLEETSAKKDTLIAENQAMVKESEGENIGQHEIHLRYKLSWVPVHCKN